MNNEVFKSKLAFKDAWIFPMSTRRWQQLSMMPFSVPVFRNFCFFLALSICVFVLQFFSYFFLSFWSTRHSFFCKWRCSVNFFESYERRFNFQIIIWSFFLFVKSNYVLEICFIWQKVQVYQLSVQLYFFPFKKSVSVTSWTSSVCTKELEVYWLYHCTWCVPSVHSETWERHWPQAELGVSEAAGRWRQDTRILRGVQSRHWDGTDHR